jgi:hypothetical protein
VTLSLFSSHRGNGVHDPKPIPDLSGPPDRLKVAPADRPKFIRGLIVEEFDGHEPPAPVLAGLAAYVDALGPAACPIRPRTPVTAATLMADARRALAAARAELAAGERPTAVLMIAAELARWLAAAPALEADLKAREPQSLFNPRRLSQAANRRLPAKPS